MSTVVMYGSVSVDGFIADPNDDPGPLFDWLLGGDVPLDDSGVLKVSQASYDHVRPYWDSIGVTVVGRHVFDHGWGGSQQVDRDVARLDAVGDVGECPQRNHAHQALAEPHVGGRLQRIEAGDLTARSAHRSHQQRRPDRPNTQLVSIVETIAIR